MAESIIQIKSLPGIKRDGTEFEGDNYVDGQWVRFQRGLPRKIGGYRSTNKYLREVSTQLSEFTEGSLTYIHSGSPNYVERFYLDTSGNSSIITDRTPASGFTADPRNMWQFAIISDTTANQLVAQVAPNQTDICNADGGEVFIGDVTGTSALVSVSLPSGGNATGGVVALYPYTFIYGSQGYVGWSVPGDPTDFAGTGAGAANITSQKIIRGLPFRGGPGNSPSGLFWSADSLLRASFVGGDQIFQFDTLSDQSSILSSNCVIEYDGVFYWPGVDRFLVFNGVVREVPNDININWFFDGLNFAARQKVFAVKIPRFGEIWWCYPRGSATECTHAVIYNVRENTWYDTELPDNGRSAGLFPAVFAKPLMTGVLPQTSQAQSATPAAGGSSYVVGDVLTVSGGIFTIPVELTVDTVSTGAVTAVTVTNAGSYTTEPTDPVSVTGGSGTGATFTVDFINPFRLWIHETGANRIDGASQQPIESWFTTSDLCLPLTSQEDRWIDVVMLEPDFVQSGDMTVQVIGRTNTRSPVVEGDIKTFSATVPVDTPEAQVIHFKEQRRLLRFKFSSNTLGGDYQMGTIMAHVQKGDGTATG